MMHQGTRWFTSTKSISQHCSLEESVNRGAKRRCPKASIHDVMTANGYIWTIPYTVCVPSGYEICQCSLEFMVR